MGWSDSPYWIKGGTILLVLDLILIIFFMASIGLDFSSNGTRDAYGWSIGITQPTLFHFYSLYDSHPFIQVLLISLQGLIAYFILGAALGWIYGKIKSRSNN